MTNDQLKQIESTLCFARFKYSQLATQENEVEHIVQWETRAEEVEQLIQIVRKEIEENK